MTTITNVFSGQSTEIHVAPTLGGTISSSTKIGEVAEMGELSTTAGVIEFTSYGQDYKQRIASGQHDAGTLSLTLNFNPGEDEHLTLKSNFDNGTETFISIVWRDGAENARADFSAIVQSFALESPQDGVVSAKIELAINGAVSLTTTTDVAL